MIAPDEIPLWLGIPAAVILWVSLLVVCFRSSAPDPDPDADTSLDIYQKTGTYPHD